MARLAKALVVAALALFLISGASIATNPAEGAIYCSLAQRW
jgi:hypothetical protein